MSGHGRERIFSAPNGCGGSTSAEEEEFSLVMGLLMEVEDCFFGFFLDVLLRGGVESVELESVSEKLFPE